VHHVGGGWQVPFEHTGVLVPQTVPHDPQLFASFAVFTHVLVLEQ
jgi:hypothetical protein